MNDAVHPRVPWLWPRLLGLVAITMAVPHGDRDRSSDETGRWSGSAYVPPEPSVPALETRWPAVLPCTRFKSLWVVDESVPGLDPHTLDVMHWGAMELRSPTSFTEIPLDASFVPFANTAWTFDTHADQVLHGHLSLELHCADGDGSIAWRCWDGSCEVAVRYEGEHDVCASDAAARDALAHPRQRPSKTGSLLAFARKVTEELDGAIAYACGGTRCDASALDALETVRRLRRLAPARLESAAIQTYPQRWDLRILDFAWRGGSDELRVHCEERDGVTHSCAAEVFAGERRVLIWEPNKCHDPAAIEIDEVDPEIASSYIYLQDTTFELSRSARMYR